MILADKSIEGTFWTLSEMPFSKKAKEKAGKMNG